MTEAKRIAAEIKASPEDARRIRACWNACQGLSTEALEAGVTGDLIEALQMAPAVPIGFAMLNPADKMRFALDYADWHKDFCSSALAKAGKP